MRNVVTGDPSPDGKGVLAIQRGIEVGHVFSGLPYPKTMNLQFVDEDGRSRPMVMGCYGIGVTRLLGAAIEQNNDAKGIIWPDALAPFTVVITPVGYRKSEAVRQTADQLYHELSGAGVDVLLDDRDERPGVMFAEMELIGIPHRVTVGERALKDGAVEVYERRTQQTVTVPWRRPMPSFGAGFRARDASCAHCRAGAFCSEQVRWRCCRTLLKPARRSTSRSPMLCKSRLPARSLTAVRRSEVSPRSMSAWRSWPGSARCQNA